ncbi:hypothetical protein GCM10018980_63640 [Streptomyces capoamus]|uniref:Uncharacterized protein n=1 Tax=Streptomyces capoamus TaxID=68183 RepID=A0A919F200_9ACTN|nr:hypothetical protein GCM10018980_63640 [Streptomyces capoamus]
MHQHDPVPRRQRLQAEPDGLLAGLPAGDDQEVGPLGQRVRVEQGLDVGGALRRGDDDHQRDVPGRGEGADRVDQHRRAVQRAECLGGARTEPHAPAGGGNHGGDGGLRGRRT